MEEIIITESFSKRLKNCCCILAADIAVLFFLLALYAKISAIYKTIFFIVLLILTILFVGFFYSLLKPQARLVINEKGFFDSIIGFVSWEHVERVFSDTENVIYIEISDLERFLEAIPEKVKNIIKSYQPYLPTTFIVVLEPENEETERIFLEDFLAVASSYPNKMAITSIFLNSPNKRFEDILKLMQEYRAAYCA